MAWQDGWTIVIVRPARFGNLHYEAPLIAFGSD